MLGLMAGFGCRKRLWKTRPASATHSGRGGERERQRGRKRGRGRGRWREREGEGEGKERQREGEEREKREKERGRGRKRQEEGEGERERRRGRREKRERDGRKGERGEREREGEGDRRRTGRERERELWLVHPAHSCSNRLGLFCVPGPLPLAGAQCMVVFLSSPRAPLSSPQSAVRGRGARPRQALLFWLRGGNTAPRPEGGELSPSVWISLLAIATSSIGTKMRPSWTMARPPASRPPSSSPGTPPEPAYKLSGSAAGSGSTPARRVPGPSPGRSGRGAGRGRRRCLPGWSSTEAEAAAGTQPS